MTRTRMTGILTGTLLLAAMGSAQAQGFASYSCFQLWKQRNSIYKSAGYCFQTARARQFFGNDGCISSNTSALPLSRGDRAAVSEIVQLERERGCNE